MTKTWILLLALASCDDSSTERDTRERFKRETGGEPAKCIAIEAKDSGEVAAICTDGKIVTICAGYGEDDGECISVSAPVEIIP